MARGSDLKTYKSTRSKASQRLRWRIVSRDNGKKISISSEGYANEAALRRSIELTHEAAGRWLKERPK